MLLLLCWLINKKQNCGAEMPIIVEATQKQLPLHSLSFVFVQVMGVCIYQQYCYEVLLTHKCLYQYQP